MNFDARMKRIIRENSNMMVPWYLMAAYAYYHLDDPILTDAAYDDLADQMLLVWDKIEHAHKHLLDEDQLEAGTLLIEDDLPGVVVGGTLHLLRERREMERRVRVGGRIE